MAIIRDINNPDNFTTYLATVALFCGISCTIMMLRFKGFKASLKLSSGKRSGMEHYELASQVSVNGAYRTNRNEYYADNNYSDSRRKITPSMIKLPQTSNHTPENIKQSRSTGDLTKVNNVPVDIRQSTPNIAVQGDQNPKEPKKGLKEQKKLEKQQLAEQKKRDKIAAQERDKQEKLRKEIEKQAAQEQAKVIKEKDKQRNKKKNVAPQPLQENIAQEPQPINVSQQPQQKNKAPQPHQKSTAPQPQGRNTVSKTKSKTSEPQHHQKAMAPQPPQATNPLSQKSSLYSTNTLESSISKSSGPPPYSEDIKIVPNKNDNTGNTSFGKPVDVSSSWDLVTQHRQQINRTTTTTGNNNKQTRLDLNYNAGNIMLSEDADNSEA